MYPESVPVTYMGEYANQVKLKDSLMSGRSSEQSIATENLVGPLTQSYNKRMTRRRNPKWLNEVQYTVTHWICQHLNSA